MAQSARTYTNKTNSKASLGRNPRNAYVYGNTVRKADVQRQLREAPSRSLSHQARKNREKAKHMDLGYVVFLMAALAMSAFVLINYIQLQSELTNRTSTISALERQLNNLKLENDEEYNRITSGIDLEKIKSIAIGELGMTYATEGQIVTYSNISNDYMRQVSGQ